MPEIRIIMGKILSAGGLALVLSLIIYPFYIKYLKVKSFGQQIRSDGPENHFIKKDTPTMGGFVLIVVALIASFVFLGKYMTNNFIALVIMVLGGMGLGLTDDLAKIMKRKSLGLRAREKLVIQILMGCFIVFFLIKYTHISIETVVPFIGAISSIPFFLVFSTVVVVGTINAVNLTDGLDGLAAGISAVCFLAYMVICYKNEQFDLAVAAFAFMCACVGFLWFNAYPAKIFMGDTGSLALGSALATFAVFTRTEFLLILIGGIFVAEAVSVILQVSYFKMTGGKRLFKMAPLHHHFEKCGWHEVEVTVRFWIISLALAVGGLLFYFKDFLKIVYK
ncbi:MAG: phospho-N-acetylmuramoyl-pentapeptide-transferase [Firmicutes bacterium]|nr:phospho-N-acetylmuramoyl-pentapeptide-transferase [Bacillota bacterium]